MRVRIKNKGSKKRLGRQRQKYQVPVPELPQTTQRLLTRKLGKVTLKTLKRLDKLSAEELEELAEAVLDFEKVEDLEAWLSSKK